MSLLIIDFDDTLVDTSANFNRAIDRFLDIMQNLGVSRSRADTEWRTTQDHYLKAGGVPHGDHLAHILIETAQMLVTGIMPGPTVDDILVTGRRAFADRAVPFTGVCEALHDLGDAGHFLVLYTKGDNETQLRRIQHSGLGAYFHGIYTTPHKTVESLRDLYHKIPVIYAPEHTWVIGDSAKSDVLPALAYGLPAIRVGTTLWKHLDAAELPEGAYTQVATFVDAANLILGRGAPAPAPETQEAAVV